MLNIKAMKRVNKFIVTMLIMAGVILLPLSVFCADAPEGALTDPDFDFLSVDAQVLDKWYSTVVEVPDRCLREALLNDLGLSPSSPITVFNMLYNLPVSLDYSHLDIKDLKGLEYALNLKKLYVGNNLISMPVQIEPIKNLYNLEVLDLSRNQLTEAPEFLFEMNGLASLNLSDNEISKIESFGEGSVLEELYLENNKLTSIPDISSLEMLTTLSVSSNALESFPEDVAGLQSLTALAVANNNLTSLPDFSPYGNLTVINLEGNNLTEFPKGIGSLTDLVQLDISNNHINEIPAEIYSLENLSALFMSFNELTSVPTELAGMKSLSVLDISMNYIKKADNTEAINALLAKIGTEAFMYTMQYEDITVTVGLDGQHKKPCLTFGGAGSVEALEGSMSLDKIVIERKIIGETSGVVYVTLTSDDLAKMQYIDHEAQTSKDYEYTITASLSGTYLGSRKFEYETVAVVDTTALERGFVFELTPANIILLVVGAVVLILVITVIVKASRKKKL